MFSPYWADTKKVSRGRVKIMMRVAAYGWKDSDKGPQGA